MASARVNVCESTTWTPPRRSLRTCLCQVPTLTMPGADACVLSRLTCAVSDAWVLLAAAVVPLLIFVYRFYDEWRYVSLVEEGLREADKESKV
eukprot:920469-Rhodomonas_salina.1